MGESGNFNRSDLPSFLRKTKRKKAHLFDEEIELDSEYAEIPTTPRWCPEVRGGEFAKRDE